MDIHNIDYGNTKPVMSYNRINSNVCVCLCVCAKGVYSIIRSKTDINQSTQFCMCFDITLTRCKITINRLMLIIPKVDNENICIFIVARKCMFSKLIMFLYLNNNLQNNKYQNKSTNDGNNG